MPLLRSASLAICLLMQQPLLTISADVIANHKVSAPLPGPPYARAHHPAGSRESTRETVVSFAAQEVEESSASSDESTEQVKEQRQPLKRKVSTASYDSVWEAATCFVFVTSRDLGV